MLRLSDNTQLMLIHLATFSVFLSLGLVIPILGPYLSSLGYSDTQIGLIALSMSVISILLRPYTGVLADYWSKRNLILLGLLSVTGAGALYLAPPPVTCLGRVFQGFTMAFFVPGSISLTTYLALKAKKLGYHMSLRSLLNGLGFTLGPYVAAFLSLRLGYHSVFIVMSITPIVFILLIPFLEDYIEERKPNITYLGSVKRWFEIGRKPFILYMTLATSIMATGYMSLQVFLSLYLNQIFGGGIALSGVFFTLSGISSMVTRGLGGVISEKIGPGITGVASFASILVGSLMLFSDSSLVIMVASVLIGFGIGLLIPSMLVGVSEVTVNTEYGSAFSLTTVSWDIGGLLGPFIGGLLSSMFIAFIIFGFYLVQSKNYRLIKY